MSTRARHPSRRLVTDPELAGLCEDVDNAIAEGSAGSSTPEDAPKAFLDQIPILRDTTIAGTTITHRGKVVGEIQLIESPAGGYLITRASWCYPGGSD
ncbi:MAG: hypothetical protein WEB03_10205 [Nitriliruptor sp.]|uniref:hypothetical protein n=1 Tax=Nitriliruptor sp. TaxID=2448056 RepID=UPI00349FEABD